MISDFEVKYILERNLNCENSFNDPSMINHKRMIHDKLL